MAKENHRKQASEVTKEIAGDKEITSISQEKSSLETREIKRLDSKYTGELINLPHWPRPLLYLMMRKKIIHLKLDN